MRIGDFVFGCARTRAGNPSVAGSTFIICPLTATAVSVELGPLTRVGCAAPAVGIAVGTVGTEVVDGRGRLDVDADIADKPGFGVADCWDSATGVGDRIGVGEAGTVVAVDGNTVGVFGTNVGTTIGNGWGGPIGVGVTEGARCTTALSASIPRTIASTPSVTT